MELIDFLLTPVYLAVIYLIASSVYRKKYRRKSYGKYFFLALNLKIASVIFFVLVYLYYYGGGDTISYYEASMGVFRVLSINPAESYSFIFSPSPEAPELVKTYSKVGYIWRGISSLTTIRITSIFTILSFGSIMVTNILFSVVSFICTWRLFLTFRNIYPHLEKNMAVAFLFVPSVLFWGSGILKDTITYSLLCLILVAFIDGILKRKFLLTGIAIVVIASVYISLIKGYILLALIPNMVLLFVLSLRNKIGNKTLQRISTPVFFSIAVVAVFLLMNAFGESLSSYSISSLEKKSEDFEMWHQYLNETEGGSGYYIGETDYSFPGVLVFAPKAINVTLFRPYLWEASSPFILLSAIESLLLLYLTILTLYKAKLTNLRKFPFNDPVLLFCISFSILLAVAVGATSYNFGALVRYKIPCLSFYLAGIFIIRSYAIKRGNSVSDRKLLKRQIIDSEHNRKHQGILTG